MDEKTKAVKVLKATHLLFHISKDEKNKRVHEMLVAISSDWPDSSEMYKQNRYKYRSTCFLFCISISIGSQKYSMLLVK